MTATDPKWDESHTIRFDDDDKPYCLHCDARTKSELLEECLYCDPLDIFGNPDREFDWLDDDDDDDWDDEDEESL